MKLQSIALTLTSSYLAIWFCGFYFLALDHDSHYEKIPVSDKKSEKNDVNENNFIGGDNVVMNAFESEQTMNDDANRKELPILTAYLKIGSKVIEYPFPDAYTYQNSNHFDYSKNDIIHPFPVIDEYPDGDSFLPWIHDLHPSSDGTKIQIYAQNRRRCHTGDGKEKLMKEMEGQIGLFQPIPISTVDDPDLSKGDTMTIKGQSYRVSSYEDANVHNETRFICRFKDDLNQNSWITYSTYPFNYEYISWRKRMDGMFDKTGKDMAQFWLSSLQFHCPIPTEIQQYNDVGVSKLKDMYLDIIPIKTPVRHGSNEYFFHEGHGGPILFDLDKNWGKKLIIPSIESSTRWENIHLRDIETPLSWGQKQESSSSSKTTTYSNKKKPFHLVACTWTSSSHNRRGDAFTITDGKERLLEWISFHLLVGYDHIVVYDNSAANTNQTTLKEVTDLFSPDLVTYVDWPCKICNNNKPANKDPGERSSQYAAEASCRGRFAPYTEWMSFMDPDEYFVPMGKYDSWKDILADLDKEGKKILKFRSTRARPLPKLMKPVYGGDRCPTREEVNGPELRKSSCLVHDNKYTFLQTYNCEYIKSPKPDRFQRAMKQIYRPDYVLSHFVHYSTVTTDLARTKDQSGHDKYMNYMRTSDPRTERFSDEINEGVLVHTKSIVPEEAVTRDSRCMPKMHPGCNVAIPCPDDIPFNDETHQDGFLDHDGNFCNCWVNRKVEKIWLPLLEKALQKVSAP